MIHKKEHQESKRLSLWELAQSATAMQQALKLEWEREDYYESLYEDIRFFAYRYEDGSGVPGASPSTEVQALEIIDTKNAYELRINKLKEKYSRWRTFLLSIDESTAFTLESYFEKGTDLQPEELSRLIRQVSNAWDSAAEVRGQAKDNQARNDYKELCERYPELRRRSDIKKYPYLIKGEIVHMTAFDYEYKVERINAY